MQAQGGDHFTFVVGTQRELFKRPNTPEIAVDEVSRLRKFLKQAGAESPTSRFEQPSRMVVVVDHHAAQIFRDQGGNRPEKEIFIEPHDPHHFHHHLVHRKEAHYQGDRVPEQTSFYEEVTTRVAAGKGDRADRSRYRQKQRCGFSSRLSEETPPRHITPC